MNTRYFHSLNTEDIKLDVYSDRPLGEDMAMTTVIDKSGTGNKLFTSYQVALFQIMEGDKILELM